MSKKMKRFFSLMLVALVMLGVTACEQDITIDSAKSEGLSFYADLAMTRAQLEYDDAAKVWKTTWEAGDVIVVEGYEFTNTAEEPNKFSCAAEGVEALVGTEVKVSYGVDKFSTAGTKGVQAGATIDNFQPGDTIALEATNSFLRYNYAGEGVVTFSLTFDGAKAQTFSYAGLLDASNVTFVGATEDRFVAFDVPESGAAATLSYSVNGVVVKSKTIDVVAGKIYNLGTLTDPEPMQYAVYVTPQPKSYFNTFSKVVNLYSWYSTDNNNASWPGVNVTEQYVVIDGRKYYYYTYPSAWSSTDVKAIVNNGTVQTADITLGKLENNYFIVYTHTSEVATAPFATVDDFAGLYLKPNSNWTLDSARFAAYFFGNGTTTTWVDMTKLANTDYYYLEAYDSKYPNVIFCRMNPATTANNWDKDNKWNQTSDLTIPTDVKNLYTVNAGTWDKGGGTWSAIK